MREIYCGRCGKAYLTDGDAACPNCWGDPMMAKPDVDLDRVVAHPSHYTAHPSGVECIQVTEHMNFCLGNAVKYIWRAGLKEGADELVDLKKAVWYLERELARRRNAQGQTKA